MRFKGTVILLIIAVLFLGYFFLIEQPKHERQRYDQVIEQRLAIFDREAVSRVSIGPPAGAPTIRFTRQDGAWRLTAPVSDIADEATINTLISSIYEAVIERRLEPDPAALGEYGLDETASTLSLMTLEGDTIFSLIVGAHTLTKSHFYARYDDSSEVLLLPATVRRYAVKELPEYRDKRVVQFHLEDVTGYRLSSDYGALEWHRAPDGEWFTLQAGDSIRGDRQEVESVIRSLRGLRVRSFVSDDPAAFAQYWERPEGTITIWSVTSPDSIVIRCGRYEEGEFYAKRDDTDRIIKLDGIFLQAFTRTVAQQRERRLLNFDRARIATITFESPDTSGSILKSGDGWSYPNPALGTIAEAGAASLLAKLETFKFDHVVSERLERRNAYGFARPSFSIALLDNEGRTIDEVIAGAPAPQTDNRYVTSTSTRLLATIEEERLRDIISSFKVIASP